MGRKVRVVMVCGEEHFYNYKQEVVSAEIVEVEKKEYPLQNRLDIALNALKRICPGVSCGNCAFSNNSSGNCTKLRARRMLQEAVGYKEE